MNGDRLRDLLSSPLDDDGGRSGDRGWARRVLAFVAAALAAGVIVVATAGFLSGDESPATTTAPVAASSTTTDAASTTTAPPPAPTGLPAGYLATGEVGLRPEWVSLDGRSVLVGMSVVVPAPVEAAEHEGFPGGAWWLLLADGREIAFSRELRSLAAPGALTVEFTVDGVQRSDVTGIRLVPASETVRATYEDHIDVAGLAGLPWESPEPPASFDVTVGGELVTVSVDSILVAATRPVRGEIRWQLDGPDDVRAIVLADVFAEAGLTEGLVPLAFPEHLVPARFAQHNRPLPSYERAGTALLFQNSPSLDVADITRLVFSWNVLVQRYEGEPLLLPLDGVG